MTVAISIILVVWSRFLHIDLMDLVGITKELNLIDYANNKSEPDGDGESGWLSIQAESKGFGRRARQTAATKKRKRAGRF